MFEWLRNNTVGKYGRYMQLKEDTFVSVEGENVKVKAVGWTEVDVMAMMIIEDEKGWAGQMRPDIPFLASYGLYWFIDASAASAWSPCIMEDEYVC